MNDGQFYNQPTNRVNNNFNRQQPTPQYVYSPQNNPNTGFGNNFQPYPNTVPQPTPYLEQYSSSPTVVFIKDASEMDGYLIGRGSGIIFIKENWEEIYQKSVDTFGKPQTRYFSLTEISSPQSKPKNNVDFSNYVTWDELNKILNNLKPQQQALGRKKQEENYE